VKKGGKIKMHEKKVALNKGATRGTLFYTAHPGSVLTDMNASVELSVEDVAQTSPPATLPSKGFTGKFVHSGEQFPW
jgi:hypothetical protein